MRYSLYFRRSEPRGPLVPGELRVGALRVFYEALPEGGTVVRVLAVGKSSAGSRG